MWKLRIHYDVGPCVTDATRIRNKECTCLLRKSDAYGIKSDVLRTGVLDHYSDIAGANYEYWVAPGQIIGCEVIEYE